MNDPVVLPQGVTFQSDYGGWNGVAGGVVTFVPEPSTMVLAMLGLVGIVWALSRRPLRLRRPPRLRLAPQRCR